MPAKLLPHARVIIGRIFEALAECCLAIQRQERDLAYLIGRAERLAVALEWVVWVCKSFAGLCSVVAACLNADVDEEIGGLASGQWAALGGAAEVGGKTLLHALLRNDVRMRRTHAALPRVLHQLFLRLLTDPEFKQTFAEAYIGA